MLVVVTGGSGSGKSAFAEETVLSLGGGEASPSLQIHVQNE